MFCSLLARIRTRYGTVEFLIDIYASGYGAKDRTCPGMRTPFRKIVA